jgi:integrase
MWRLYAMTGMRRGEALGLTWRFVDLRAGSVEVVQQLHPDLSIGPPKTDRGERTITLDPGTVEALREHRQAQLLERDFAGDAHQDRDFVFADAIGEPIRPRLVTKRFREHRDAAGISTGRLHSLRHTATTLMLTKGVPLHTVAARIGDDPTTMLRTYAKHLPHSDAAAADAMAGVLAPADTTLTNHPGNGSVEPSIP